MTDQPSTTIRPPPHDGATVPPRAEPVTPLAATVRVVRVSLHAGSAVLAAATQLLDAVSPPTTGR